MSTTPGGYREMAVFDPATGDTVTATIMQVLSDAAPDLEYFQAASGKRREMARSRILSVLVEDVSSLYQLLAWSDAETDLQAVLRGMSRHLQWYESVTPSVRQAPGAPGQLAGYVVELSTRKKAASVYAFTNLLEYLGWADADSDGVVDGYTDDGAGYDDASSSMSGTTFTMATDPASGALARFYVDVIFPFPGTTVTLSVDVVSEYGGTGTDRFHMEAKNFAGTNVGTASQTVPGTGRQSVALTLPADTYKIRVYPAEVFGMSGAADDIQIALPALRVDGITTETRF